MREHTMENNNWHEGQVGAVAVVLGTQLIKDKSFMEDVKTYSQNLAVAFYDYKEAYDKVHRDCMLRVYKWNGIPDNIITLLSSIMVNWKTSISRWINIMCGFLQGGSHLPVGSCKSEIPVCKLLQESKGYRMEQPEKKDVKCTHSLFVDDLKLYQKNHKTLKDVNEMIVKASNDTGECYGVVECAEVVFERDKMVKDEGLQVLNERINTIDPDDNKIHKFLGFEQA